jgi:hypothetical protein
LYQWPRHFRNSAIGGWFDAGGSGDVCRRHFGGDVIQARLRAKQMTVFGLIVLGLAMGLVFGLALEKTRVFEPGMMIGQFQLRNFIMLKVFLSAAATGLVSTRF